MTIGQCIFGYFEKEGTERRSTRMEHDEWCYVEEMECGRLIVVSTLKKGRQKLKVWLDVEADGSFNTMTDSKVETKDEMDRIEKVSFAKYSMSCYTTRRQILTLV